MGTSATLRRTGAATAMVAVALTGIALSAPAAPAHAAVTSSSGKWLWEGTATTVGNVKDGVDWDRSVNPTGKGVTIALIDTGVAPVPGLTTGNVVYGPDLSIDSQDPTKRYTDGFGHGTHLAGLISSKSTGLTGLAPGAKLLSVKVGGSTGAVDVSQVLAGIDWTVAHKNDDPANPVRVMVLAYGTDGVQKYDIDPLCAAVENAWRAGITVIVSGGNDGNSAHLLTPATDKYVISVGAMDENGTTTWSDDKAATFTSLGDTTRKVDLLSPGRSLVSLRDPGSYVDTNFPGARIGTSYFLGSGSSQAAAVAGAVAADLLELFPSLTPDQIKNLLIDSDVSVVGTSIGLIDLHWAYTDYRNSQSGYSASRSAQTFTKSTGKGLLEASRGTAHLSDGTVQLTGENDLFGPFSTTAWATASAAKTSWVGGSWMGHDWTGAGWETTSSGATSWAGRAWSGRAWSGRAWSGRAWSSDSWQSITPQTKGW
ncbi:MAG: serine protease AprX [Cryptosporangiaceae bacterium]|nr:serine protease AprX [Cryptosporangiaceae bacterium]